MEVKFRHFFPEFIQVGSFQPNFRFNSPRLWSQSSVISSLTRFDAIFFPVTEVWRQFSIGIISELDRLRRYAAPTCQISLHGQKRPGSTFVSPLIGFTSGASHEIGMVVFKLLVICEILNFYLLYKNDKTACNFE